MSATILTVNALEHNVGVTSVLLTLGERLNYFSNSRVCLIELDHENPSFSEILEKSVSNIGIDEIFPFLFDETETEKDVKEIINHNTLHFKNVDIDVIYGTRSRHFFKEEQLKKFLEIVRENYDVLLIDYGNKRLPNAIIDITDYNLLIVQPSNRYIAKLEKNARNFLLDKKTKLILNNAPKKFQNIYLTLRDKFRDFDVIGELPYSEVLESNMFKGIINIEKGDYAYRMNKLAFSLCKKLNIPIKQKSNLITKLTGKYQERQNDISLKFFETLPLCDILINEKICTIEDIEKCLAIREKQLLENS